MEPLNWTLCDPDELEAFEGDLVDLVAHLEEWTARRNGSRAAGSGDAAASNGADDVDAVSKLLRGADVVGGRRLAQSFMTGTDLLQLDLNVQGKSLVGVFLRQRITPGLPGLWPLFDHAANLYAFLDAIPGALDRAKETVLEYGTFFANEAIVADDGSFTIYPDFPALPEAYAGALRGNLDTLRKTAAEEPQTPDGEPSLLQRTLAHVDAALAGHEALGFNSVEYDRNEDHYFFVIFMTYGNGLFSAKIAVNRATGAPTMTDDQPLAEIPPATRPPRLPQQVLAPALMPRIGPAGDGAASPARVRTISAKEASDLLAHGSALEDTTVEGDLALPRSASLASLRIRNSDINGNLILTGLQVSGEVQIENLRVSGGIDLRNARVGGSMRLIGVRVQALGGAGGGVANGVELRDASVGGVLELADCEIDGPLTLSDVQVDAVVRLSSIRAQAFHGRRLAVVRGPIVIAPSHSGGSEAGKASRPAAFGMIVGGDLDLSGGSTPSRLALDGIHVGGTATLDEVRVGGGLSLGRDHDMAFFVRQDLRLSGARVEGSVLMRGAHIGRSIFMVGGAIGGGFRIGSAHSDARRRYADCAIGQDLSLSYVDVKGPLSLAGVQIQGTMRLEAGAFGAVVLEGRFVVDVLGDSAGVLLPTKIRNRLELVACEVRGALRLSAALIDEQYAGRYAVEITSSKIGQGVLFWDEELAEPRSTESLAGYLNQVAVELGRARSQWRFEPYQSAASLAIHGGWPVWFADRGSATDVTANAQSSDEEISVRELLANLSARHLFTEIRGDVRMALCKIGGDLCLTNLRAPGRKLLFEGLEIEGDLAADWNGRRYVTNAGDWTVLYRNLLHTRAGLLKFSGSTIKGEARLTGLRLSGQGERREPGPDGDPTMPALAITHSTVDGVVALSESGPEAGSFGDELARAEIEGDLDVSWSSIDHLILDGRCLGMSLDLPAPESPNRSPHRLVAANATIRKLELRDPLPGAVDLADARVTVWDFGPVEPGQLLERFSNVLDNQAPFKRNVYQEVEAYLHNSGFEDLAKRIHVKLVGRQHEDSTRRLRRDNEPLRARSFVWFRRIMSRINWVATGNFTSEWRPLTLCLLLWVLSTGYFLDPSRIDIAAMYKRNFAERPQPICAVLNRWGVWESAKFTARYVLPVVPSVGFDELDAGDDLSTHSTCLGAAERIRASGNTADWFRPSTIASLVRIASWLFFSLATGTVFAKMSRTPRGNG